MTIDPFARPVVQLLTGDDDADRAAAVWAGGWGTPWAPSTVGIRAAREIAVLEPSLAVVGIPAAGGDDFVAAAVRIALECSVPVVCVPWHLTDRLCAVGPLLRGPVVAAVRSAHEAAAILPSARRAARGAGRRLQVLEVEGGGNDRADAAFDTAGHVASLLVVAVDEVGRASLGHRTASGTMTPTMLVPTVLAAGSRTRRPGSAAPSRVSPAERTRSS